MAKSCNCWTLLFPKNVCNVSVDIATVVVDTLHFFLWKLPIFSSSEVSVLLVLQPSPFPTRWVDNFSSDMETPIGVVCLGGARVPGSLKRKTERRGGLGKKVGLRDKLDH